MNRIGPVAPSKRLILVSALVILVLCLPTGLFMTQSTWKPLLDAQLNKPTATPAPTRVTSAEPSAVPFSISTPTGVPFSITPGAQKGEVTVCVLGGFGTYEMFLLTQYLSNLPVHIKILPLEFYDPVTGIKLTRGTESEQPQMLADGTCDLMMTTHDSLAKFPSTQSKMIAVVDRSHGVDYIAAYLVGVTEGCKKQIGYINDIVGCRIAVAGGSVSEYLLMSALYSAQIAPDQVHIDRFETAEQAEDAFVAKQDDVVVSWVPGEKTIINGVTQILLDTRYFTNVYDVILVSHNADANKKQEVVGALYGFFAAIKMYVENPTQSAKLISEWEFTDSDGIKHPTNAWSLVGTDDPLGDMQALLDGVAPATYDNNMYYAGKQTVWINMLNTARTYWEYSQQPMETPFDAAALTDTSYLEALQANTELRPVAGATFDDKTFSPEPLPQAPPTADQLIKLPTLLDIKCNVDNVYFQPGESTISPETQQYEEFKKCATNTAQLALQTDMQFLIIGASGQPDPACYPRNPPYSYEYSVNLATARAEWLMGQLNNYGVPKDRMAYTIEVGPLACKESGLRDWRFGHFEAKPGGGGG